MHIAIIGLPNSTKTTIFNALTRGDLETTAFSSGAVRGSHRRRGRAGSARGSPVGHVPAAQDHLRQSDLRRHRRPGARASARAGLSGPLLNTLSQSDALLHVVRAFEDPDVPHIEGSIDPCRDVDILDGELLLSDLIIVERRIERLQAQLKKGGDKLVKAANEAELALFCNACTRRWTPARRCATWNSTPAEEKSLRNYGLLTLKPLLIVLNVGDEPAERRARAGCADYRHRHTTVATLQGRIEMELAQMPPEEAAEFLAGYGIRSRA